MSHVPQEPGPAGHARGERMVVLRGYVLMGVHQVYLMIAKAEQLSSPATVSPGAVGLVTHGGAVVAQSIRNP